MPCLLHARIQQKQIRLMITITDGDIGNGEMRGDQHHHKIASSLIHSMQTHLADEMQMSACILKKGRQQRPSKRTGSVIISSIEIPRHPAFQVSLVVEHKQLLYTDLCWKACAARP